VIVGSNPTGVANMQINKRFKFGVLWSKALDHESVIETIIENFGPIGDRWHIHILYGLMFINEEDAIMAKMLVPFSEIKKLKNKED
jgi:hypothetical protein